MRCAAVLGLMSVREFAPSDKLPTGSEAAER